MSKTSISVTNF